MKFRTTSTAVDVDMGPTIALQLLTAPIMIFFMKMSAIDIRPGESLWPSTDPQYPPHHL
jgi:hypothetical protein